MLSLTTGGPETMYSETGLYGFIDDILFPIHHGIFRYVGFDVLPPFIAWAVNRIGEEQRKYYLETYEKRLLSIDKTPAITYPALADYDEKFQLKSANKAS